MTSAVWAAGSQAHGAVLDRRHDHVRASLRGAPCRGRDRLGRSAGEHDLAVSGSEELGDGVARVLDGDSGGVTLGVHPCRDRPPGGDFIHSTIASMASGRVGEVDA